jgi:hypothetical protein
MRINDLWGDKMHKIEMRQSLLSILKKYSLYSILGISFIIQLSVAIIFNWRYSWDTWSYFTAADELLRCEIDVYRTPSYPALIALAKLISRNNFVSIIGVLQIVGSLSSIIVLKKMAERLEISRNIIKTILAIFIIAPIILKVNITIITESFAVSGSIWLFYFIVNWCYGERTWKDMIIIIIISLFLLFLRPSFLYLLIVFAVITLIALVLKQYKKVAQMSLCVIILSSFMLGYCTIIKSKIDVFIPSTVSIFNDRIIALDNGFLRSENVTNPVIKSRVIAFEKAGVRPNIWNAPDVTGIPDKIVYEELRALKNKDRVGWYTKTFIHNVSSSLGDSILGYGSVCIISFFEVYLILLVIPIFWMIIRKKKDGIPIVALSMWLTCVGNILVMIFGAYSQWQRLFLPSLPLFLLLVGQFCSLFKVELTKDSKQIL